MMKVSSAMEGWQRDEAVRFGRLRKGTTPPNHTQRGGFGRAAHTEAGYFAGATTGPCARWSRWFILSAGILLFVTGAAKIVSALGRVAILGKPDPIFGIPFNYLLLSVGLIELVIAVLCLTPTNPNLALGLVAALSINFFGYLAGLWLIHWPGYCPCLGTLTQALHLSRHHANVLTGIILSYLLLGSFSFLAWSWWALKGKLRSSPGGNTLVEFSGSAGHCG